MRRGLPLGTPEANWSDHWVNCLGGLGVGRTGGTWSIFGWCQDLARSWHSKQLWSFYHVLLALKLTDIHLFLPPNLSFCIGHGSRMGMDPKQAGQISLKYITPCENHPCLQVIKKMSLTNNIKPSLSLSQWVCLSSCAMKHWDEGFPLNFADNHILSMDGHGESGPLNSMNIA